MSFLKNRRKLTLIAIDAFIMLAVYGGTLLLMYSSTGLYLEPYCYALNFMVMAVSVFLARFLVRVYSNVWRYANSQSFIDIVLADAVGGIIGLLITYLPFAAPIHVGAWKVITFVALSDIVTLFSRFSYQLYYKHCNKDVKSVRSTKIGVAIVGAGQVGALLADELLYNTNSHYNPVCFIDRDSAKVGSRVCGLPVYSEDDMTERIKLHAVQEIFIALPKISGEEAGRLHEHYAKTGCKVKLYDFPVKDAGGSSKRVIREFKIEDLLFRDSLRVFDKATRTLYADHVILVTGGGGSIGSELCRQIAKCLPKQLIIFDIYENNAYDIEQELRRKYGESLNLAVEIGSVRDRARLDAVFAHYRPEIVFHAAAHKHVPLMEHSNCEAVKNNVIWQRSTVSGSLYLYQLTGRSIQLT